MIHRVEAPRDPRFAPFALLGRLMPLPQDAEAKAERQILHRADLNDRVRR